MTALPKDYQARKAIPLYDFLTKYFPLAIVGLTKVAVAGNEQHNPGEPLHWARGKSMDQLNTAMRHMFDHGMGNVYDETSPTVGPTMHLAKAAWRLLAEIQLICERDQAAIDAAPLVGLDPAPAPDQCTARVVQGSGRVLTCILRHEHGGAHSYDLGGIRFTGR